MNPEFPVDPHFNIQTYLHDMRMERRQDHADLVKRVDEGFKTITERTDKLSEDLNQHELDDVKVQGELEAKLDRVLTVHSVVKWVATTTVGGLILAGIGIAANHWPFK